MVTDAGAAPNQHQNDITSYHYYWLYQTFGTWWNLFPTCIQTKSRWITRNNKMDERGIGICILPI